MDGKICVRGRAPEVPIAPGLVEDAPYDQTMRLFMLLPDGTVEQRVGTSETLAQDWSELNVGAVLEVTTGRKAHKRRVSPTDVFCVCTPESFHSVNPYEYHVGLAGDLTISAQGRMVVVYAPRTWVEIEPSALTGDFRVAVDEPDLSVGLH